VVTGSGVGGSVKAVHAVQTVQTESAAAARRRVRNPSGRLAW
jgi:hypothetical protein